VPHYVAWVNVLRGGLNAVLAWVALMACILTYTVHWEYDDKHHPHWDKDDYRHTMTVVSSHSNAAALVKIMVNHRLLFFWLKPAAALSCCASSSHGNIYESLTLKAADTQGKGSK
jgi:hypothetical protein